MSFQQPDVVVVGAGIIGASIAWKLSAAGLRVSLVDARAMGNEASWAGAGMLAPGGETKGRPEWARLLLEGCQAYSSYVAELESETGIRIDYRRCGAVEVARDELESHELLADSRANQALGV